MLDVHPDELLQKAQLTDDERARLDAHLKLCRACAIELQLAKDLRTEPMATTDDEDLVTRSIERALAERAPRRRKLLPYLLIAAAAMLTFFAWAKLRTPDEPEIPPYVPNAPIATTSVPVDAPSPPPASSSATPRPAPSVEAPRPTPAKPSAAQLFADANEARRTGDVDRSVLLYRQLQLNHPSSPETTTSRIAFGRLLLDKLGDAPGARAQFNEYLTAAPSGTLAEEARVGLALSAAKLGDAGRERAAWLELLAKHPESVHAERARKRIAELGP
jgi:TolA-binding protein